MEDRVLIVGGVAGGATAAARLRRLNERAEIIIFEKSGYVSFANCGLPYYVGDVIKDRDDLLVQTPEGLRARFNIDVRVHSEVVAVNTEAKTVRVKPRDGDVYEEAYDFLVLAPGAKPLKPSIPGINSPNVFTWRNMEDTDAIKAFVTHKGRKTAVVVGGGFIGIEAAENFKALGLHVTLVEAAPHILAPFDTEVVAAAEKTLQDNGIDLILSDGVVAFADTAEGGVAVTLQSGRVITADFVLFAAGVTPDTDFLKESGVALGPKGHIITDEFLRTNCDGVFAAGDAVELTDIVTGMKTAVPLAGPANKQGRIVADNICGKNVKYRGAQGSAVIKLFDVTAAATGANARTLERVGVPFREVLLHPASPAAYYPGSTQMVLKLLYAPDGKVLGAQAIGRHGADKRVDVLATLIHFGGTVYDAAELELCYAPPYNSPKDPVNVAAYAAVNDLENTTDVFTPAEIDPAGSTLLDVRTRREFSQGHIEGAVNIPVDELRGRLGEISKEKPVQVYCQVGLRGNVAARILTQNGFAAKNMTGGYKSYMQAK